VGLEAFEAADPPLVIPDAVRVVVGGHHVVAGDLLGERDASMRLVWEYLPPPMLSDSAGEVGG
jgi:hypothetical protein